jgi:Carbohydrate esterase, sialic acid-specific acetylesterase
MDSLPLFMNKLPLYALLILFCFSGDLFAQLSLFAPHARQVFQRDLNNRASVPVAGVAPAGTTNVQARCIPLVAGQGTITDWANLSLSANSQVFSGTISVTGGWYQLQVRARNSAAVILSKTALNRVGVGEVFVIAGQSNAFGGFDESNNAADDRVLGIDSQQEDVAEQMLPLWFSRVSSRSKFAPSNWAYCWANLGDLLTARLNVPVLFLGSAMGGTSSSQWQQSAAGISGNGVTSGLSPYRRLGTALWHYAARTGLRAVLWHQGESDNIYNTPVQTYFDNINYVIQNSRRQIGFNGLAWVISRVSYINGTTNQTIINAQNNLIAQVPGLWPGPITDNFVGTTFRPDNIHFGGATGLSVIANLWNQSLTDSFFQTAPAFLPAPPALLTVGYTLPNVRRQGETMQIPFVTDAPANVATTFRAQLVRTADETLLAQSAPASQNPFLFTLPTSLPDGNYRFRLVSNEPTISSPLGETFTVRASASAYTNASAVAPPTLGGIPNEAIIRIGAKFDASTHGFNTLIYSTTAVDTRLDRIDGGTFADNVWHLAAPTSSFPDFNYTQQYLPISFAVGGVEPGARYRLSVRLTGTTGPGQWIDITFLDNRNTLYIGFEPAPTPPVIPCDDGLFVTAKDGLWNDPAVWACGAVPTIGAMVNLKHRVTIPAGYVALGGTLRYDLGGGLVFGTAGWLKLSP